MNKSNIKNLPTYPRDITYCANKRCTKTDCLRHDNNTQNFSPNALISMSVFCEGKGEGCEYYWKMEGENK